MKAASKEDSLRGLFLHDSGWYQYQAKVSRPWVLLCPSKSGANPAANSKDKFTLLLRPCWFKGHLVI